MRFRRIAVIAAGVLVASASMLSLAASPAAIKAGEWQVTIEELDSSLGQKLYELDKKRYDLRLGQAQSRLNQYLLESESKAAGVDLSTLVKTALENNREEVTDADVKAFMAVNVGRIPEGVTEEQVRGYMEDQQRKLALAEYVASLQEKYGAEVLLEEPVAPRVEIKGSGKLSKGAADARVTIVEFSDFECPYCAKVQGTLDAVLKAYPDDVRLVYRHFPLSFHKNARAASEATLCAEDQGKFWPMHDEIFEDQKNMSVDDLKRHAKTIKLDVEKFTACLEARTHNDYVEADIEEANRIGITATPTFYINGRKLEGGYDVASFRKMIEKEL